MLRRRLSIVCVLLALAGAHLSAMTTSQLQTVKDHIAASGDLNTMPVGEDGSVAIAAILNLPAAVDFWVWRTFVADTELYEATSPDATSWSWTIYVNRSQGERDAWRQMVNMSGGINPSLANARTAIADIFSGAGGLAQRTHLLAMGRRKASRFEKLLATGTGSTGSPGFLVVEGPITSADVEQARHLP